MLTTTGHRLPGAPGRLVTETSAWGALIVLTAISYVVAGTSGFVETIGGRAFTTLAGTLSAGEFDNRAGSLSLLIVFVFAGAGLFLPAKVFAGRGSTVRKLALGIATLAEAALLIVLSLAPSAWLTWVSALILGAAVGLLMSVTPFTNEKPWRRVGVPATMLLFLACSFQIMGGSAAGTSALGWMSLIVGIVMAAGAVMVYLTPERALHAEAATTGAFPVAKARVARPPATIEKPWVPIALFAVLGAVFILAQPTAVEHGFGQAGYALMLVVALLGWAIGFEMGPTFAPGMSRPRVSAFALAVAGILVIAIGAVDELSGKVVLAGAVAFLVGIGVRSQVYDFPRRIGAVGGALIALLINVADIIVAPLGTAPEWSLLPADLAFVVIGLAALVGGVVGLFVFDPHGMQGLSVDIVHGFRPHNHAEDASKHGVGALADRFGPGFFIAIEGGDGSGKSTQIARVARALADEGYSVEPTREPGGTEIGRTIRSVLFDAEPPSPRTEALLFAADRAHHIASLVDPGLEAGRIVITDRYIDSTIAYQAAGREFDQETILALSRWATDGLIPHLTIVLDIAPEVAAERMNARGGTNYLDEESQEFHQRVRQTYLSRAAKNPERYVVLDASADPDELTTQILEAVRARLPHTLTKGSIAEAGRTEAGNHSAAGPEGGSGVAAEAGTPVDDDEGEATERINLGADLRDEASHRPAGHGTPFLGQSAEGAGSGRGDSAPAESPRPPQAPQASEPVDDSMSASEPEDVSAPAFEPEDVSAHEEGGDARDDAGTEGVVVSSDEAATTVMPTAPRAPLNDDDDPDAVPTNVIDTSAVTGTADGSDAGPSDSAATESDEAATTVLPARSARQMSRERLQAQAEIERQARERVRRQRERNRNRFNGPGGEQ